MRLTVDLCLSYIFSGGLPMAHPQMLTETDHTAYRCQSRASSTARHAMR